MRKHVENRFVFMSIVYALCLYGISSYASFCSGELEIGMGVAIVASEEVKSIEIKM